MLGFDFCLEFFIWLTFESYFCSEFGFHEQEDEPYITKISTLKHKIDMLYFYQQKSWKVNR